jgi:N-carbamoylputrescine amidase
MSAPFTIAILQSACTADPQANLDKTIAQIRQAAAQGANIICTQELFRTLYFCQSQDPANFAYAESIPGPTTEIFAKLAKELSVALVASLFERRAPGLYHNTAAVLDSDGSLLGAYRKMHIPDDPLFYEKYYFTPGDLGFRTFQTKFGRIGVLICWDQWYPEAARLTALQDCSVLFYPTAIAWHPREQPAVNAAQRDAWITIQRSHAIANGLYVASANRHGLEKLPTSGADAPVGCNAGVSPASAEGPLAHPPSPTAQNRPSLTTPFAPAPSQGLDFWGSSFIADPFGQILTQAPTNQDAILLATIDPQKIEQTRQLWPFLRDRRIDAYAAITTRYGQ